MLPGLVARAGFYVLEKDIILKNRWNFDFPISGHMYDEVYILRYVYAKVLKNSMFFTI